MSKKVATCTLGANGNPLR